MKTMKNLMILGCGAMLPFVAISCKEAKDKAQEAQAKGKEALAMIPKDISGVAGLFEKMNAKLESVTDLESAKKAMPGLEKIGLMMKKAQDAMGGEDKMEAMLEKAPPEAKEKFSKAMGGLAGHMKRIKESSPEAFDYIDKKMDSIMGK